LTLNILQLKDAVNLFVFVYCVLKIFLGKSIMQWRSSTFFIAFTLLIVLSLGGIALRTTQAQSHVSMATLSLLVSDDEHVVVELISPTPELNSVILDGVSYYDVSIAGLNNTAASGAPLLPVYGRLLGIPPGAEISVRVLASETERIPLTLPVAPAPTQLVDTDPSLALPEVQDLVYHLDPLIYGVDRLTPDNPVAVDAPTLWRGQNVAPLRLYPVQFNPVTGELLFHRRLRVEVRFAGAPQQRQLTPPTVDPHFTPLLERSMINYAAAEKWRRDPVPLAQPSTRTLPGGQPWYKVAVDSDAIYTLTCSDLAAAGIDLAILNLSTLQLFSGGPGGVEVALYVVDDGEPGRCDSGDRIQFWGQGIESKYTVENIYWLTHGASLGKRMETRSSQPGGEAVTTTRANLRLEQNRVYVSQAPRIEDYDHWFWDTLTTTSVANPPSRTYSFNLDAGTTVMTVTTTLAGYLGNHRTRVALNGVVLGETSWSGTGPIQLSYAVPAELALTTSNTIEVAKTLANSSHDLVDRFDLDLVRPLQAVDDRLDLVAPGPGQWRYTTQGFSTPEVNLFDISNPENPVRITAAEIAGPCPCTMAFGDSVASEAQYAAVGPDAVTSPLLITPVFPSNLRAATNGADYILITHADFRSSVEPLASHRRSQGLRVAVVDVQDIYDEFNGGVLHPGAIRDFLAYTYANWQKPSPTYVLLVGDGHRDPKDYCATPGTCFGTTMPNTNFIPAYLRMVDPWIGETAADAQLVALNPDNSLPFMALGRLPVNTPAEADAVVAKILAYELNPEEGEWRSRLAFVADNAYQTDGSLDPAGNFWRLSDDLVNDASLILPTLTADRLYLNVCNPAVHAHCNLPEPPYTPYTSGAAIKSAVIDAFNEGSILVNYIGHASYQGWAGNPVIFRTPDIGQLTNSTKLPMILDMTCYTGYYHISYVGLPSLAEALVRKPDGGAIASWAASGLSVVTGHDLMNKGFLNAMMQEGIYEIGLATIAGLETLYTKGGGRYLENLDTFLLFGDPALKLAVVGGPPPAPKTPTGDPTGPEDPDPTETPTPTPTPDGDEAPTPPPDGSVTPTPTPEPLVPVETPVPTITPVVPTGPTDARIYLPLLTR
jgi:hypothetical protein